MMFFVGFCEKIIFWNLWFYCLVALQLNNLDEQSYNLIKLFIHFRIHAPGIIEFHRSKMVSFNQMRCFPEVFFFLNKSKNVFLHFMLDIFKYVKRFKKAWDEVVVCQLHSDNYFMKKGTFANFIEMKMRLCSKTTVCDSWYYVIQGIYNKGRSNGID